MKKKIIVTGCNGLVGSSVVDLLKDQQVEIIGVGRSKNHEIQMINLDLGAAWSEEQLPKRTDIIIHLAQSELFRDFPNSAKEVFSVNTVSTVKLLDYARKAGAQKFIYASSGGIYGNSNEEFNEDSEVNITSDIGFYLSTKFCSELLVQSYSGYFSTDILRFFFVYGKKQREDMLIPRLVNSIRNGVEITLQGESGIKINPVYVEDAAKAVISCFNLKGNNRINIAGNQIFDLRAICEIIGEKLNKKPIFRIQDSEPKHLVADITRMKKILVDPKVRFEDGIKSLL